ncbi:lipid IV(A) 3-deoxy-D-manno-octulosonic acid transferase [Vibrio sp. 10N.261.55.A7]|uniref:lipid IV(A) 3-deoxy-D-manno-octulosonic acid transferase n=1 Tax=Vibrio sp. 10N.261.55.A7 TaxID=1880851 RepID=UPI000C826C93|nr:lipid IV(A) 3-deoxy-D-manno-octulosonic acid transferase [Vibrio sp. 10N.261.55.A7]PMK05047.1 3-deoxy-D-manno-octulosonic acid transferase [Vibrio sp. 10N.261.55.A7]
MTTMVRWCYTILLSLISPILLWGLYRPKTNKPPFGRRWKEHFGFTPKIDDRKSGVIWIHAVSVGEVLASKKLVEKLAAKNPDKRILVTTTTSTGAAQVEKMDNGIIHRYMPIDFSWCVRGFINAIQPEKMLIIETELWPNTIHTVANNHIPITLINGRLSEKSVGNYRKLNTLIYPAVSQLHLILTVHADDKSRFESLGVSSEKIIVTGSIKYDVTLDQDIEVQGNALKNALGTSRKIVVAASTHQGEDEQILEAYQQAKMEAPELLLVIVPRHPERFDRVADLVLSQGLSLARRSDSVENIDRHVDVYLGDTMGELMVMLSASDLVFMGGSLIGKKVGGHNFIEPALLKKYCLTGPSYFNFPDLANQLIESNALSVVLDANDLAMQIVSALVKPDQLTEKGQWGYDIVKRNQGALHKTLELVSTSPNIETPS